MPPKNRTEPFACDDADNDGYVAKTPWAIHRDEEGIVWIGQEHIGWADNVSLVKSGAEGITTVIFTVRTDEVSLVNDVLGSPVAPASHPAPVAPQMRPGGMVQVDVNARVMCRCGHSIGGHRRAKSYKTAGWQTFTHPGTVYCTGNGIGSCSCTQFRAKNLCQCGHAHEAHLGTVDVNGENVMPCRYPTDMGEFCSCEDYKGVEFHYGLFIPK